jgi:hydrogenase-4 component F
MDLFDIFNNFSEPVKTLIIYTSGTLLVCLLMYFTKNKLIDYLLFIPFVGLQIYLNIKEYAEIGITKSDGLEDYFKIDHLGFIFLTLTTIVSIPVIIHSAFYAFSREESHRETEIHNISLVLFIANMSGAIISCNVGLMWAFLEATTLCASMLIYHERSAAALEAAWKYVFVCSIGIALAFVGILFLGLANKSFHELNFSIEALKIAVARMDVIWLKLSFLFILTGYSVKIGIVPLFTVDIDAKDAAPSPVGALLSGALLNVGFLSVFRFYEIFSVTEILPWMNTVMIIVGLLSIAFAAVYLLKVANFKRMLAYSSMEHAGIAFIAVSMGGIGYSIAILHLLFHALTKAALFIQIGQVYKLFQGKNMEDASGYIRLNSWGAIVLLLGLFAITAFPPSALFISEYFLFKLLIFSKVYWLAFVLAILLTVIMATLATKFLNLIFLSTKSNNIQSQTAQIGFVESISQYLLLIVVFVAGINPPNFIIQFINESVKQIPHYLPL